MCVWDCSVCTRSRSIPLPYTINEAAKNTWIRPKRLYEYNKYVCANDSMASFQRFRVFISILLRFLSLVYFLFRTSLFSLLTFYVDDTESIRKCRRRREKTQRESSYKLSAIGYGCNVYNILCAMRVVCIWWQNTLNSEAVWYTKAKYTALSKFLIDWTWIDGVCFFFFFRHCSYFVCVCLKSLKFPSNRRIQPCWLNVCVLFLPSFAVIVSVSCFKCIAWRCIKQSINDISKGVNRERWTRNKR